jgi:hypothetical protein
VGLDVSYVHGKSYAVWANDEGWLSFAALYVSWHISSPLWGKWSRRLKPKITAIAYEIFRYRSRTHEKQMHYLRGLWLNFQGVWPGQASLVRNVARITRSHRFGDFANKVMI